MRKLGRRDLFVVVFAKTESGSQEKIWLCSGLVTSGAIQDFKEIPSVALGAKKNMVISFPYFQHCYTSFPVNPSMRRESKKLIRIC